MKVYISGPMEGLPKKNFPAFFAAERELNLNHGIEFAFNPARRSVAWDPATGDVGDNWHSNKRRALVVGLEWICDHATALVMLDGWECSSEAVAEKATADALGIPVYIGIDALVRGQQYARTSVDSIRDPSVMMPEAVKLNQRRIDGNYGPRRCPGGSSFYDWLNACESELKEVRDAYVSGRIDEVRSELGDVMANVIQTALYLKIHDPDTACVETLAKVKRRLDYVEEHADKKMSYADRWRQAKIQVG
jgi:NTP pyrophosphatase (non-canonical NTP hydrolase)